MGSISNEKQILDTLSGGSASILIQLLVNDEDGIMKQNTKSGGGQLYLPFEYKEKVKELTKQHDEIGKAINDIVSAGPATACGEDETELCNEIAMAVKQELRDSGLSREQLLDRMNQFLGRTEEGHTERLCKKPLTLNMLNNYLSKPSEYPIPAAFLFAFQSIFGTHRVSNMIVSASGAQVISGEDLRRLALIKVRELRESAARLEKMI